MIWWDYHALVVIASGWKFEGLRFEPMQLQGPLTRGCQIK